MSAGLRKREARVRGDLETRIHELIDLAEAVSGAAPALVRDRVAAVVEKALHIAELGGQLCEAIRVQHPAKGTGP